MGFSISGAFKSIGKAAKGAWKGAKGVIKSPITKAIVGATAVAFPAVGIPAAAGLAAAETAVRYGERAEKEVKRAKKLMRSASPAKRKKGRKLARKAKTNRAKWKRMMRNTVRSGKSSWKFARSTQLLALAKRRDAVRRALLADKRAATRRKAPSRKRGRQVTLYLRDGTVLRGRMG